MTSEKKSRLQKRVLFFKNKLQRVQGIRLASGIFFVAALFVISSAPSPIWTWITLAYWFLVFPFLVKISKQLRHHIQCLEEMDAFYQRQTDKQNGVVKSQFYSSQGPKDELNITGPGSLFDYVNECWSLEGAQRLESEISSGCADLEEIQNRQKWIQSLASQRLPLLKLKVQMAVLNPKGFSLGKTFQRLSEIRAPFAMEKITILVWALAVLGIGFSLYGVISNSWSFFLWVGFWIFQAISIQMRGAEFFKALEIENSLKSMLPVFHLTLKRASYFSFCKTLTQPQVIPRFSRIQLLTSLLSAETHILINIVVNMLMPYHALVSWGLYSEVGLFRKEKDNIQKEMAFLDIISSLVFLYIHHTKTFPQFHKDLSLQAEGVYLPLIPRTDVVANDFSISDPQKITLITGSNMSGKSTFLRTIAQNQMLALIGAPVFAKNFKTFVCRVESCINVTDSVMLSYSYFLSEVRRLKEIFDEVQIHRVMFFLDELFRGTNQKERVIAARSYLQALASKDALGFVTSHDREITELADIHKTYKTCYFEEDFTTEDIAFTYEIQDGVANTTNALKILKREGLPVDESN